MHVRVFVSYAQESQADVERALQIVAALRDSGIDATMDKHHPAPQEGWPRWMQQQLRDADFVAVICTRVYRERAEGRAPDGVGRGANYEGRIIDMDLYERGGVNKRYVPIVPEGLAPDDVVPVFLRGYTYFAWPAGLERLLRHLTNQPEHLPTTLGAVPVLPPAARPSSPVQQKPAAVRGMPSAQYGDVSSHVSVSSPSEHVFLARYFQEGVATSGNIGIGFYDLSIVNESDRVITLKDVLFRYEYDGAVYDEGPQTLITGSVPAAADGVGCRAIILDAPVEAAEVVLMNWNNIQPRVFSREPLLPGAVLTGSAFFVLQCKRFSQVPRIRRPGFMITDFSGGHSFHEYPIEEAYDRSSARNLRIRVRDFTR